MGQVIHVFSEFEKLWISKNLDPHRFMTGVCTCGAVGDDLRTWGYFPCVETVKRLTVSDFQDVVRGGRELEDEAMKDYEGVVSVDIV
jgi:hypothetical protein